MTRSLRVYPGCVSIIVLAIFAFVPRATYAQQTLGTIDGVVTDSSGAVIPQADVGVRNVGTNLTVTAQTKGDGSFSVADLPIGTYEVTISKQGFEKAVYPQIIVQGNLTTTLKATLQPGEITTSVTVEATPLLNQTDTSNGYTLGTDVIQSTPLGTGSFTQLAILAPGTSADFLSGSGSNEGLGNQGIWANGQRDTSNSFTFNSVNADNLFNGNSTSNMADSRFTLNTGEVFGAGGQVQTNTSVYDAIGEGLPTPPTETIQELQVTTSMYDASMGQKSGAHIELTTRSGTNDYHGQAYEYFQNSALDAAPTFVVPNDFFSGAPPLHRNVFGGTIGGPIKKDKLFFFASYQRQQLSDALNGTFSGVPTLAGLTDADRSDPTSLVNLVNYDAGLSSTLGGTCTNSSKVKCITVGEVDPVALNIFQLKLKNGQYLIPSDTIGVNIGPESSLQKFNSAISGPPSTFNADQANANIDYNFSSSDRISAKYYYQNDPTTSPFAVSNVSGFPQTLQAGSQVFSLDNTTVVSPNATWEQRFGFIRQIANVSTGQAITPGAVGLTLPGGQLFPGITIGYADEGAATTGGGTIEPLHGNELHIGPSTNFANAGVFQNQFEGSSKYDWVLGKHTLSFGGTFDYTQFNVDNRENDVAELDFYDFSDFLTGTLGSSGTRGPTKLSGVTVLDGETNRHFRAKSTGLYAQDDFKISSNLTVNIGVRWDWDGPLYEANGLLTNFYPQDFGYDLGTDTFNPVNGTPGIGIVVAGNNKTFGTKGVSDSTLTGRQWGFAPRIGFAWSPRKNLVVRAGFGMFYDRGEYFSELSTSAGLGISGPFSVTTQEPFTVQILTPIGCANALNCLSNSTGPFGTTLPTPPTSLAAVAALVPDMRQMSACNQATAPGLQQPNEPYCNVNSGTTALPFLFGGYNPTNVLPYSENWSLDLQWQPSNDLVLTLGYLGNRGVHLVLPIPFNQPEIATPSHPVNNQIYSYGYLAANGSDCDGYNDETSTCFQLPAEEVQTQLGHYSFSDGNTALRAPYIGISPNADLWTTNGISFYNALQLSATKRLSHGLQFNASYTYSHALDEGSGLGAGLFFNGNNPLDPRTSYASSDFDRTHVFIISYLYNLPTIKDAHGLLNVAANGWGVTGVTTLESGEPFSIIDYSGTAGGIYYSSDDYITNPLLPLASGVTPKQAMSRAGGGGNLVNGLPYVNPNDFSVPALSPGQDGVPPCETISGYAVCDNFETGYGSTGRNVFRSPFQTRFDFSVFKNFQLTQRFNLKFEADAFNIFNHPSLDAPYSDFELNPCFNPVPCYGTTPPASEGYGVIDGTIGSNRFMQFALHLTF
ncbi:MAG TPA: TonB-dependent receptor [Candidatus Baltobacteraceae bacterium]|nr:TonB-dependent receptor [Candidatus Baltobacteraceae bacterium]